MNRARVTTLPWAVIAAAALLLPGPSMAEPADTEPMACTMETPPTDAATETTASRRPATELASDETGQDAVIAGSGRVVTHLDRTAYRHRLAITIDDGPGRYTDEMIKILEREKVPATFFLIAPDGDSSEVAARIAGKGFAVGNHTAHHRNLRTLTRSGQDDEVRWAAQRLCSGSKEQVALLRPPYGAWNQATLDAAAANEETVVLWDVDSRDWALKGNPRRIIRNVLKGARDGSIVLLHERSQTVAVLPEIIRRLRERGFSFVAIR